MKQRNIFLALLFSVLTLGIYYLYWFVKVTNDSNRLAPKNATMGGVKAIFISMLTLGIYQLYWFYRLGEKAGEMLDTSSKGILYLLLGFFTLSVVPLCMGQASINRALSLHTNEG